MNEFFMPEENDPNYQEAREYVNRSEYILPIESQIKIYNDYDDMPFFKRLVEEDCE